MSIVFGFEPYSIEVLVARGSMFTSAIVTDDSWPADVEIELRFSESDDGVVRHRWAADIADDQAIWDVPADEVDRLIAGPARRARLMFIVDGVPTLWGKGVARVG